MTRPLRHTLAPLWVATLAACLASSQARAQLRVVTYNTLDKPFNDTHVAQLRTLFDAIAATPRNGVAKRPDVVALQEQTTFSATDSTAARIAAELNGLFATDSYEARLIGFGVDKLAVVFDNASVTLTGATQFATGGPRPALRALFQPVGYDAPEASLALYAAHLKAGGNSADRTTRALESQAIRNNAAALGAGANVIYAGDFNFSSSGEQGFANLTAAGDGRARDPLGLPSWPNALVAEHMTQSTRVSSLSDGGADGGMDDRFDLQLVTDGLLDGEGLSYLGPTSAGLSGLEHSYQAFGNDGVSWNSSINNQLAGRSQSADVLNALHNFSDHLPVLADYQLPAVMEVLAGEVPAAVAQGEPLSLAVTVRNAAGVAAAVGADELDYALVTEGDLIGNFAGTALALASGGVHEVLLDTSTPGLKAGLITVSTASQAAQNNLVTIPVAFEVIAAGLAGDFNDDGRVDAADYATWRDGLAEGVFTATDYALWRGGFGQPAAGAAQRVPSPGRGRLLLAAGVVLLGAWNLGGRRSPRAHPPL